jgi:hypothetical protein
MRRVKGIRKNIRKLTAALTVLFVSLVWVLPVRAEGEGSADFTVAALSQYIWRGQELSRDSLVIQPSATVSHSGFSANLWGNLDTDPYFAMPDDSGGMWNETDLTLSYGRGFGVWSLEGGYIYYGLEGIDDSQEFYLNLGFDVLLEPALTVYKDFDSYEHWYILLGLSHAFEISDTVSLELAASGSYLLSEEKEAYPKIDSSGAATTDNFSNFHDGVVSASLPIAVGVVTITPTVSYVFPLSDEASDEMKWRSFDSDTDTFVYGGVMVGIAF